MRTCPHCQFLVSDGATTCSVCHQDLASAPVGVAAAADPALTPVASAASVAPAFPDPPPPPPGTAPQWAPPADPASFGQPGPPPWGAGPVVPGAVPPFPGSPPPAPSGRSAARLGLIAGASAVLGVIVVAFLCIGVVTLLGRTPTPVAADQLLWQSYRHPEGAFRVEVPGVPQLETVPAPAELGATTSVEVVSVSAEDFYASVGTFPGMVADGMTFAQVPFSAEGAAQGAASNGFEDARVVSHQVVPGSGDLQLQMELQGTVDAEAAVMLSRLVLVGPDLYELSVLGPADQRGELLEIQERIAATFQAPATG